MERVRAHVFISGDVQGVGFRSFVYNNALLLGVKGFVRNLNDGRVEAVFEGEKSKVERMIDLCRKGPLLAWVRDVEVRKESYANEFRDFRIIR